MTGFDRSDSDSTGRLERNWTATICKGDGWTDIKLAHAHRGSPRGFIRSTASRPVCGPDCRHSPLHIPFPDVQFLYLHFGRKCDWRKGLSPPLALA